MGDLAQWNLQLPRQLGEDISVILTERDGDAAGLTDFVERALRIELMRTIMAEARRGFGDMPEEEIDKLVDDEVSMVRKERAIRV